MHRVPYALVPALFAALTALSGSALAASAPSVAKASQTTAAQAGSNAVSLSALESAARSAAAQAAARQLEASSNAAAIAAALGGRLTAREVAWAVGTVAAHPVEGHLVDNLARALNVTPSRLLVALAAVGALRVPAAVAGQSRPLAKSVPVNQIPATSGLVAALAAAGNSNTGQAALARLAATASAASIARRLGQGLTARDVAWTIDTVAAQKTSGPVLAALAGALGVSTAALGRAITQTVA